MAENLPQVESGNTDLLIVARVSPTRQTAVNGKKEAWEGRVAADSILSPALNHRVRRRSPAVSTRQHASH